MILILGGTTEGRMAVKVADEAGSLYYYATRGSLQQIVCKHGIHVTGGMNLPCMIDFCRSHSIRLLVDAAHPFAMELHRTVAAASEALQLPVVRVERTYPEYTTDLIWCDDYEDAMKKLKESGITRLLALTGVQTIGKLQDYWKENTCWFRILRREESLVIARSQGFDEQNIVYYEEEGEEELISRLQPQAILTKESGDSGGFSQKVEAARKYNLPVYVVKRPELPRHFVCVTGEHGLRKQIETHVSDFFSLRSGFTTGACATAASKAALLALLSFTGLRPGAAYKAYCDVTPLSEKRLTNAPKSSSAPRRYVFEFTTARKDTPKTLHVSPSGSNLNDGSTPAKAMAGINAAIKRAAPGDTILIHSGVYREALKVHATGSPGKVLTIAGAPGAEVIIDGDGSLLRGVEIRGREFVKIDNLNFIRLAGSGAVSDAAAVVVRDSSDIRISRIFHDNRSGSSQRSFVGSNTKNMLIENCVAITPFGGYEFYKCPNLEIRHSVFFRGKTINGRIMTSMTAPAKVHHCIFVGQEIQKVKNPTFGASEIAAFTEHDNGFFVRVPRAEKPIIGFNSLNGKILPKNDGGDILNKEWVRQGRFYNQILTYDLFCKELNRKATALFSDPQMKALPFYHKFESLQQWYDQFVLGKGGKEVKNKFRTARQKELRQDEKLRITDFIATAPEYRKRNIGLDPAAFDKR